MTTKEELASDPDILALSNVDDALLPVLSPMVCATVLLSRKLVAKNSLCIAR